MPSLIATPATSLALTYTLAPYANIFSLNAPSSNVHTVSSSLPPKIAVSNKPVYTTAATDKFCVMPSSDHQSYQNLGSLDQSKQQHVPSLSRPVGKEYIRLELQRLEEEQRLHEEEYTRKKELLRRRYNLMQEMAYDSESADPYTKMEERQLPPSMFQRSKQNLPQEHQLHYPKTAERHVMPDQPTIINHPAQLHPRISQQPFERRHQRRVPDDTYVDFAAADGRIQQDVARLPMYSAQGQFTPRHRSTPQYRAFRSTPGNAHEEVYLEGDLTNSQVAARKAVSQELPVFSGVPEEWPLFYATYNTTSSMCRFTSEENLIRLQKCLRGKAYEAVKCMLMSPSNVGGIISTLKMLFGDPEIIVNNLISRIRTTPSPHADRLETMVEFALSVKNLCATIDACKLNEYTYNVALLRELVEKLPIQYQVDWVRYRRSIADVRLTTFCDWLYDFAETISPIASFANANPKLSKNAKRGPAYLNMHTEIDDDQLLESREYNAQFYQVREPKGKPKQHFQSTVEVDRSCKICKGNCTSLEKCKRFCEFSYKGRWAAVNEFGLCKRCLGRHFRTACKSKIICGQNGCSYKHHPLLHKFQNVDSVVKEDDPVVSADCNIHYKRSNHVLFRVVPVFLCGPCKTIKTFAFLDDGSSVTLMESALAAELGVTGKTEPLCLRWTSNKTLHELDSENVTFNISGTTSGLKRYRLPEVHTVANLGLFHQSLNLQDLSKQYSHLRGIPVESYHNVQPRILIGSNNANLGYVLRGREGKMHEPVATRTRLGWIVYGGGETNNHNFSGYHGVHMCQCIGNQNDMLLQAMRDYFSIDGLGITKSTTLIESNDDRRAREILKSFKRRDDGRFEGRLLWKYDKFRLPNSKTHALRRYECLEIRMKKDASLANVLREKIQDYVSKGYIRKLNADEIERDDQRVWYLPIFPVVNINKPNKIRIVWDAAAKSHGTALNSLLLKGPDQNTSLVDVLIRFRQHRIAVCGDIREMFHQVMVSKEDQHFQRFLWKENPSDTSPSTYVMQVLTFGACCSPSIAQYVKNVNAGEFAGQYPLAAAAIIENHYVDDMLVSVESEQEAIRLANEVRFVHEQAGFEMRNWIFNSTEVLTALNQPNTLNKSLNLDSELTTEKVLGMWWCTSTDSFTYRLSKRHDDELLAGNRIPTKREVLRTLMSVFDPLGFLSNLLIHLKIILQQTWRTSIGWDEQIPKNIFDRWLEWIAVLPKVKEIRIPRCFRAEVSSGLDTNVQLHTFVDASELGYAAVVYLRFKQHDKTECVIVAAKSRVAPLKFLSIPRMELEAALIGARLANSICKAWNLNINQRYFWSDSRDVLCWIRSDHRRYSNYVGHRVSEILDSTLMSEWRWIPTDENVADEGTKYQRSPELKNDSRWLNGPEFLKEDEPTWPIERVVTKPTQEELKASIYHHIHLHQVKVELFEAKRFRSWNHLRRTAAWVRRYLINRNNQAHNKPIFLGPLTGQEIHKAELVLFKQAQLEKFSEEITILSDGNVSRKLIPKSSSIYELWPFLDEHRVLRARTRIGACKMASMDAKHPIILPKISPITNLIVHHYHVRFYHRNHRTVLNELRQRFRIVPRLASILWQVRTNCQICKNLRAVPQPPPMSDLPITRLAAFSRPFSFVGVDYFGPINVTVRRSSEKRWGVLITCLTVRAIHIEIAYSLSAQSCIMALRNFMGRRGVPIEIFSDRGTNMVGASKELLTALNSMDQNLVIQEISSPNTTWSFIPPASPHMGGSWERMIQSVKRNLNQIKPRHQLSDEVLKNLLIEIENVVNSRPLTNLPLENDSSPVLTPNHFLLGSSNGLKPATSFDDSNQALRNTWQTSQIEANVFWKRWIRDYLPDLTKRTKWIDPSKSIRVDDVVLVVDPNLPRNCWPLGRVISATTGKDGEVREAVVQTANGIYERPAVKLAVLDVRRDVVVNQQLVYGGECHCAPPSK
ncbi:uncharacterized protein LOC129741828 [Uranotaenia lowii]|uniref:uncharacterized protein LOC129741828 n=1 Tax=Uranotaenia lowii TaxID=190385 RepID=UPI002479B0B6|nr:uncharacterized protein LOC129741828 [Uranotaenia lowii]